MTDAPKKYDFSTETLTALGCISGLIVGMIIGIVVGIAIGLHLAS